MRHPCSREGSAASLDPESYGFLWPHSGPSSTRSRKLAISDFLHTSRPTQTQAPRLIPKTSNNEMLMMLEDQQRKILAMVLAKSTARLKTRMCKIGTDLLQILKQNDRPSREALEAIITADCKMLTECDFGLEQSHIRDMAPPNILAPLVQFLADVKSFAGLFQKAMHALSPLFLGTGLDFTAEFVKSTEPLLSSAFVKDSEVKAKSARSPNK